MQKASRVKWITGITDACDRTHRWIRGSALRGDEFQLPDSNPKTAWVELFYLECEWKSQNSTQPGPPWAWALCEEPCWCMPRTAQRHFSNGEIVLHAKCYHIANSPPEGAKVSVFFLEFKHSNSQSLILPLIALLCLVGSIFWKPIKTNW